MINCKDSINWLENLKQAIGKPQHSELWHYEQALTEVIEMLSDRSEMIDLSSMVGKTIYILNHKGAIYANPKFNGSIWELEVTGYHYNSISRKSGFYLICGCGCGYPERIHSSRIGKDVFFSLEAAEAKLSEEGLL